MSSRLYKKAGMKIPAFFTDPNVFLVLLCLIPFIKGLKEKVDDVDKSVDNSLELVDNHYKAVYKDCSRT